MSNRHTGSRHNDAAWEVVQSFVDSIPAGAKMDEAQLVKLLGERLQRAGVATAEKGMGVLSVSRETVRLMSAEDRTDNCRLVCKSDKAYDCFWVCL